MGVAVQEGGSRSIGKEPTKNTAAAGQLPSTELGVKLKLILMTLLTTTFSNVKALIFWFNPAKSSFL
jgi:hypothetical protein